MRTLKKKSPVAHCSVRRAKKIVFMLVILLCLLLKSYHFGDQLKKWNAPKVLIDLDAFEAWIAKQGGAL